MGLDPSDRKALWFTAHPLSIISLNLNDLKLIMLGVESLAFTQDCLVFSLHQCGLAVKETAYDIHLYNMVDYVGGLRNGENYHAFIIQYIRTFSPAEDHSAV